MSADCLREAGLIGEDHDLLHIGNQIENIDVLCAEVDQRSKAFQRFVVIEDKLCRNPEGRRDVLGQIIDYSKKLHELNFDDFVELVPEAVADWCEANRVAIGRALAEHRMLLLICSDQVRQSLIEYTRHLNDVFPLRQMELALMSLNIYSDGERHLFVPNVAGTMPLPRRTLVVKVEVTGRNSQPEDARVTTEWQTPKAGGRRLIQETELLDRIGPRGIAGEGGSRNPPAGRGEDRCRGRIRRCFGEGANLQLLDSPARHVVRGHAARHVLRALIQPMARGGRCRTRIVGAVPSEADRHHRQEPADGIRRCRGQTCHEACGTRRYCTRSRILAAVEDVIPVLRNAPAPEKPDDEQ